MSRLFGWDLPPGVRECDIPGNRPGDDHFKACPCHDDADPICECGCYYDTHLAEAVCCNDKECLCEGWKVDEDPDCICDELADDAKASAADAREAAREEGWEQP